MRKKNIQIVGISSFTYIESAHTRNIKAIQFRRRFLLRHEFPFEVQYGIWFWRKVAHADKSYVLGANMLKIYRIAYDSVFRFLPILLSGVCCLSGPTTHLQIWIIRRSVSGRIRSKNILRLSHKSYDFFCSPLPVGQPKQSWNNLEPHPANCQLSVCVKKMPASHVSIQIANGSDRLIRVFHFHAIESFAVPNKQA